MVRWFISISIFICLALLPPAQLWSETTAYFPNYGDDNIKRVIVTDESNFVSVDLSGGVYGAAVTPDGDALVITRTDDDAVTIIPTGSFTNVSAQDDVSLGAGHAPRGVAIESRGLYAYVANYANDTVDEILIGSGTVTDTFSVGTGPWGVAAIYDTTDTTMRVYVSNYDAGTVSVISSSGVDTINSVGSGPLGVALTPDGNTLYVANYYDDQVVAIDTSDQSIDSTINVGNGPWGLAMADDGGYVFVTNSLDDTVSVIDTASRIAAGPFSVGDQPRGVAAPVNGDFAYVVNQGDNNISKVTTSGSVTTIGSGELNGAFALGAFIGDSPPDPPSSLEAATESSTGISLSWNDNANDELGFKIERRKDSQDTYVQVAKVDQNETSYTDAGLSRATTYHYQVRAYNEAADSDYSNVATAMTDESFSWCFIDALFQ